MARPDYTKFLSGRANYVEPSPIREMVSRIAKKSRETQVISFAAGDPDPDVIPRITYAEIAKEVFEKEKRSVIYTPTEGVPDLVEEVAKFMKSYEKASVEPGNIVITHGGSQALDLIGRLMINSGDVVLVENPSYVNTLLAWKHFGARVVGIPMDENGMKTDVLESTVKKLKSERRVVKLVYTIPTGQNPSGITMSMDRRKHLLEVASTYDLLVVEDGAYNYLVYEPVEIRSLVSMDTEGRVIFAGTFSKVLGTGLRVGWLALPSELAEVFKFAKGPTDMCPSSPSQLIVLYALRRGLFEEARKKAIEAYRAKRDLMIKSIEAYMPGLEHTRPVAGMFVLLKLPGTIDAWSFATELLEKYAVAVIPAAPFYTDESGRSVLRLNFSMPPANLIEEGVKRIATLLKERVSSK